MIPEPAEQFETTEDVELITDGGSLLVVGDDRSTVEHFLRDNGLFERSRALGRYARGPALRSSAEALRTVADVVAESGMWMWVKLTPESAVAIKKFGLTESGVPGVRYANGGNPWVH